VRFSKSLFAVVGFATVVGCAEGEQPEVLTYEEFRAQAYQEPDTGIYVVNGDEIIETEDAMRIAYDNFLTSIRDANLRDEGYAVAEQGLIINRVGGQDDKWNTATAQNLTYCVDSKSFGSRYTTVVNAMASATAEWESATGGGVNFVHDASQDSKCNARNTSVVFDVRQVRSAQYLARAFFPSTSRSGREILVSTSSFGNISPWTLTGVLRHELGHTIGFRHEHTRPESGTCFEDNNWRALTAYDSSSVMHYPQCNGTQNGDLVLTSSDKSGANSVY